MTFPAIYTIANTIIASIHFNCLFARLVFLKIYIMIYVVYVCVCESKIAIMDNIKLMSG